jgi:hypothetical protein
MSHSGRHSSSPYAAAIGSLLISFAGAGPCQAGCPNDYAKLDDRAQHATDAFNSAGASSRCDRARDLVLIEQRLLRFVEDYQVQCVLDPEVIEVQQRRVSNAKAAQDRSCGQKQ